MLKLRDFNYLPQFEACFDQLVAEGPGLIVLSGIESRPLHAPPGEAFIASGLSALFDILVHAILESLPGRQVIVVSRDRRSMRVPRQFRGRMKFLPVEGGQSYDRQIHTAVSLNPALLVIDRLTQETAPAAFTAARHGMKVLSTFDSPLRGPALARQFLTLGVEPGQLDALTWLVSMQRLARLCPSCRQQLSIPLTDLRRITRRCPGLSAQVAALSAPRPFWRSPGCDHCRRTGRSGDVAVFDVYRAYTQEGIASPLTLDSLLPLEEYIYHLALEGSLDLDDLAWYETDQLRRAYDLLAASGQALDGASSALQGKLFELEASNRVLLQRTEALMSLEDLGKALIESVDLRDLAARICRRAGELSGADRVMLYLLIAGPAGDRAQVLASHGWQDFQVIPLLDAIQLFDPTDRPAPGRYTDLPPGLAPRAGEPQTPAAAIKTGLRVPLLAQERQVGLMIIQSTRKAAFTPGETALLRTFANQAALAIQRAGLVDDLRAKITELEAAQAELVMKERMERELELAREVQRRLLPRDFPPLPGFTVVARSQPARQVGGDFYDVIALDEDHFALVIADVSDKGMPAALYMGLSRSLILAEAHRGLSPRLTLEDVNRLLLELGDLDGFVSVFYGVVQTSTRVLRYARAGHEKPWLLRPGSDPIQLGGSGLVLGIMETALLNLSEEQLVLAPGDRLVLYTDGVTDVPGPGGQFFGASRLEALLRGLTAVPAPQICATVFAALETHRAGEDPFDDTTLLALEVG